jgi:hypothetical protein
MKDIIRKVLTEGSRKDSAYNKYVANMVGDVKGRMEEAYNVFVDDDPSGNHKYLTWMLKKYVLAVVTDDYLFLGTYNPIKIVDIVTKFHKNVQRLAKKDINQYRTVKELDNTIESLPETKREKKLTGADKIFEDKYLTVILPKTQEGSCLYGASTKWCTAAKSGNAFDDYNSRGYLYYIIWKPKLPEKLHNYQKIARYIGYGKPYETEGEHYISDDSRKDSGDIEYELFGVGYVDSKTIYSTRKTIPEGSRGVYNSWEDAKIAIDTHYAKNGMNQEPTEYDGYGDEEDWDEEDYEDEEF